MTRTYYIRPAVLPALLLCGSLPLRARVHRALLLALFLCGSLPLRAQVLITELMPAPVAGMPEWIELTNVDADSVDLAGWVLRDAAGGRAVLSAPGRLPPGGSVVVASAAGLEAALPGREACITIIPQLPSLNNGGDELALLDAGGRRVDTMVYRSGWGYEGGVSLERVSVAWEGTARANWLPSVAPARMTPCAQNSVALPMRDAALGTLRVIGEARLEAPLRVVSVVRNVGMGVVGSVDLVVYEDEDGDGVPDPVERVIDGHWSMLQPGDSVLLEWMLDASSAPRRVLFSELRADGDERADNDTRIDTLRMGVPLGTVVINEVMYAPKDGEPEWIELFNVSNMDVELGGWMVGDNDAWRVLPPVTVRAFDHLVLASSGTIVEWHPDVGERLCVMGVPSLNNGGDQVRLRNGSGRMIDSMSYLPDWGGADGRSLERINHRITTVDRTNWSASVDPRGTPGRRNGMAIRDLDVAPQWIRARGDDRIELCVRNVGMMSTLESRVVLGADRNRNGVLEAGEPVFEQSLPGLVAGDSIVLVFDQRGGGTAGRRRWIAHTDLATDERRGNDTLRMMTHRSPMAGTLRVNEILPAPFTSEAEWIEIVHAGGSSVALDGMQVLDEATAGGSRNTVTISTDAVLEEGSFVVVTADSSILRRYPDLRSRMHALIVVSQSLSLSDDGDAVVLRDADAHMIDSVRYASSWHHPEVIDVRGRSLERLHPSLPSALATSWSTCPRADGGTPAARNALWIDVTRETAAAMIDASPNPFSPDGDGHEDLCTIAYRLPVATSLLRLRVFDSRGRLCRTLSAGQLSGPEGVLVFDGMDEQRRRLDIGMYVLLAEAVTAGGQIVAASKSVLVIATRL